MPLHPRVRLASFVFALVCFFLPFVTVSCPGTSTTFTGTQMAFGTTVEEPQFMGPPRPRRVPGDPLALAAFASAAIGIAVSFGGAAVFRTLSVGLGVAGAVLLLLLKNKMDTEVQKQGLGVVRLMYGAGFWLAFLSSIAAAILSLVSPPRAPASAVAPLAMAPEPATEGAETVGGIALPHPIASSADAVVKRYCANCGTKLGIGSKFCPDCGTVV